jgi:hypothetical protein
MAFSLLIDCFFPGVAIIASRCDYIGKGGWSIWVNRDHPFFMFRLFCPLWVDIVAKVSNRGAAIRALLCPNRRFAAAQR